MPSRVTLRVGDAVLLHFGRVRPGDRAAHCSDTDRGHGDEEPPPQVTQRAPPSRKTEPLLHVNRHAAKPQSLKGREKNPHVATFQVSADLTCPHRPGYLPPVGSGSSSESLDPALSPGGSSESSGLIFWACRPTGALAFVGPWHSHSRLSWSWPSSPALPGLPGSCGRARRRLARPRRAQRRDRPPARAA